jgi:hypothetical protein
VEYRADPAACNACPLHRSFHAAYFERVQGYYPTAAYQTALRKRKVWVEPLFAEAKDWHRLRRFRLRRLWRVNGEALLIAAGRNLKHLLQKHGWGRRPFPAEAAQAPIPRSFLRQMDRCSRIWRMRLYAWPLGQARLA